LAKSVTSQQFFRPCVLYLMCGRYSQFGDLQQLRLRFQIEMIAETPVQRYNIAPSQNAPVVLWDNGRVLRLMQWGLVPHWAKDEKIGNKMINARAETLTEKRSFKNLLASNRCLVLADGFYEWRPTKTGKGKSPVRIVLKDRGSFAFAGLWDRSKRSDGSEFFSYTIITTEANELISPFHHRMPVILEAQSENIWLKGAAEDSEILLGLLRPYPPAEMELYEVAAKVNSPRTDSLECILPIL
jgi:putative SOS response-associated peptidase YedK